MNPVSARIARISQQLREHAAERAEHRELERQILTYTSESDRAELYAILDRYTPSEGAAVRRILEGACV